MASTPLLGLALPTDGTTSWGTLVNTSITALLDSAVAGTTTLASDADATLSTTLDAANEARQAVLLCTGSRAAIRTITAPARSKTYVVINATTGGFGVKIVGVGPTTGVTVPNGRAYMVAWNGSDFVITGITTVNLTSDVTGTLPVANGGTGVTISTGSNAVVLNTSPTIASPDLTGTPTAPTASAGTNTTQVATTAFVQAALQALHPIGSIYINATNATNPGTLLGFGTWTAFGAGRVPVGFNAANPLFDTAEEIGGSANAVVVSHDHTATSTDSGHTHTIGYTGNLFYSGGGGGSNTFWGAGTNQATNSGTANVTTTVNSNGVSGTDANYQPYITVYMWKRTA